MDLVGTLEVTIDTNLAIAFEGRRYTARDVAIGECANHLLTELGQ